MINDSFGRHVGDLVVQSVADGLKNHFGGGESLAHLDGGTFAAMIVGSESYEDAVRLLHDRISAFREHAPGRNPCRLPRADGKLHRLTHEYLSSNLELHRCPR